MAVARPVFSVRADGSGRACRAKVTIKNVKVAIQQAQNICYGHEDKQACRVAWDNVEEISEAYARQREREILIKNQEELCKEEPLACREYDV